jgi:hypothetical protein
MTPAEALTRLARLPKPRRKDGGKRSRAFRRRLAARRRAIVNEAGGWAAVESERLRRIYEPFFATAWEPVPPVTATDLARMVAVETMASYTRPPFRTLTGADFTPQVDRRSEG